MKIFCIDRVPIPNRNFERSLNNSNRNNYNNYNHFESNNQHSNRLGNYTRNWRNRNWNSRNISSRIRYDNDVNTSNSSFIQPSNENNNNNNHIKDDTNHTNGMYVNGSDSDVSSENDSHFPGSGPSTPVTSDDEQVYKNTPN